MTTLDDKEIELMTRDICRAKGLVCLVPIKGFSGITCHEKTLCDCEVESMLFEALKQIRDATAELMEEVSQKQEHRVREETISKYKNARLVGPSEEENTKACDAFCKTRRFEHEAIVHLAWQTAIDYFRSQLHLEPAIKMPSEEEIVKASQFRIVNPAIAPELAKVLMAMRKTEWLDCFNWLRSQLRLEPAPEPQKSLIKLIDRLLNKVNLVTCPYIHGNPVSNDAMNQLCERQLEIEKALAAELRLDDVTDKPQKHYKSVQDVTAPINDRIPNLLGDVKESRVTSSNENKSDGQRLYDLYTQKTVQPLSDDEVYLEYCKDPIPEGVLFYPKDLWLKCWRAAEKRILGETK